MGGSIKGGKHIRSCFLYFVVLLFHYMGVGRPGKCAKGGLGVFLDIGKSILRSFLSETFSESCRSRSFSVSCRSEVSRYLVDPD